MSNAYLSVEKVSKSFPVADGDSATTGDGRFCVFQEVNLEMERGEFLTTIGHSGCGKSTLLNIIAGFESASEGCVILDGKEVSGSGLDRMVVFQNFALMPWLSAYENVRVAVRAARPGWKRDQIKAETLRHLELMGLKGAANKLPTFLSGGMRQRVGIARAFAVHPKVLLLDEPFAQIDALTRGVIQDELLRMWEATRSTVFMVTHDVDEAILLSDRIALMSNGPNAYIAEVVDIPLPRPRVREELLDSPDYNRLRSHILRFLMKGAKIRPLAESPVAAESPPRSRTGTG